MDTPQL